MVHGPTPALSPPQGKQTFSVLALPLLPHLISCPTRVLPLVALTSVSDVRATETMAVLCITLWHRALARAQPHARGLTRCLPDFTAISKVQLKKCLPLSSSESLAEPTSHGEGLCAAPSCSSSCSFQQKLSFPSLMGEREIDTQRQRERWRQIDR